MLAIRNVSGEDVTGAANIANYNPLRYRGYYYDSETGLYYLRSRYYDPQVKRFLNGDTVVAVNDKINSNNVFTYCFNNPLVFDDQSGCYVGWDDAAAILAGGAVSVLTQAALDLTSGSFGTPESYVGAFVGGAVGGWMSLYYPEFSGAISGGASEFVKDLLENYTGKSNMGLDEMIVNASLAAAEGLVIDFLFDSIPSRLRSNERVASSNCEKAMNNISYSQSFSSRRISFYKFFSNSLSSSCARSLPTVVVNGLGLVFKTIDYLI